MLVGLINGKGHRVLFEDIPKKYMRKDWPLPAEMTWNTGGAWPLAFLLALSRDNRQPNKVHVSSLLHSVLRETIKKREPYYQKPENMLFISDGSALHSWLAQYGGILAENRYDMKLDIDTGSPVTITGEPDYAQHEGMLIDHKRMNVYALKLCVQNGLEKERPENAMQLRFYNVLLNANGIRPMPPFYIFAWASNWQKKWRAKDQDPRMAEFEVHPTPHDKDELMTRARAYVMASTMDIEQLPPCEDREQFGMVKGSNGMPKRCQDFCEVNGFCPFYKTVKKGLGLFA